MGYPAWLGGCTAEEAEWLFKHQNDVRRLISGEAEIVPIDERIQATREVFDPIVRVNRTDCPNYPPFISEVVHPELENLGPAYFDVRESVEMWLHPNQGRVKGTVIYNYLRKNGILGHCLGIREAMAIQERGPGFLRHFFLDPTRDHPRVSWLLAWKSVFPDGQFGAAYLSVPFLRDIGESVEIGKINIENEIYSDCPALKFKF